MEDEENEFGEFLKFETLSFCPIDRKLINPELLDKKEIDWLNKYHREVYEKLSPYLAENEQKWLIDKSSAL